MSNRNSLFVNALVFHMQRHCSEFFGYLGRESGLFGGRGNAQEQHFLASAKGGADPWHIVMYGLPILIFTDKGLGEILVAAICQ